MSKYSAASTHSSASKQSAGSNQSAPFKNDDKKSSNPLSNKKEIKIEEHLQDINEVVAKYNTNLKNGLTATQAQNLLKANGPNQLTPPKKVPEWLKFVKQLSGGFSLLLWFGAFLCIIVYVIDVCRKPEPSKDNLYLGIVLILVVLLTGAFAYYQEAKSSKIMDSFKDLIPRKAFVLRDGNIKEIDPKILVVGDVVEISSGDQVPADILIFESFGCKVDNSSLTGESEPQARTPLCTHNNPMETENIAFFSTYCTEGKARGIVIRVGDYTAIGQIAFLTTGLDDAETSIAREIRLFIKYITIFACSLGFIFFVVSMIIGNSWLDAMIFFIGIIVANVPEGLMATVTVSLSLTAKSMAKKNCLVKNLQAVETLGSTSIICSDKTGTLTQNKMRVSHIWFDNEIIEINCQLKDIPKHKIIKSTYLNKENMFEDFLRVCTLCSKTKFKPDQEKVPIFKRECSGDASETALFKFVACVGVNTDQIRTKFPISAEIPFNSTNKFHLTVHTLKDENVKHKYLVCIKGAPERVLKLCSAILIAGKSRLFDSHSTKAMEKIFEHLASMGERVLGFAEMYTNDIDSLFEDESRTKVNLSNVSNFTLLGLMSLIDPARPEVPEAVSKCRLAGIQVFMVTGDHPITARAIAETVGIISKPKEDIIVFDSGIFENLKKLKAKDKSPLNGKAIVVPGDMLSQLSNSQLDYIVRNASEIVFARTSPEQKLFIVQSCQRLGHIVAATGDGVNDSPALKSANIGIAMGITGSDVSKQAADMILMDDNFASIVFGIEEGRVIFDNLKKSIAYTLASNFAEIMPFLVYVTMGFPLALGTITILCIDLGTDIIPAISLAYEKAEEDIMKQKPRHRDDHLVTRRMFNRAYFQIGMVQASAGFMTYFIVMADHGFFINDLFGLREAWDSEQYLMYNRFGELYSFKDRKILEHVCQTAYFSAIVMCQVADLIICKTRRNSIMKQGMRNTILTWSLFIEISLALFLIYCPGMKSILNVYPLKWWYWCIAMPFSIFIFLYDETRRMILRLRPHGFFQKATYF